MGGSRTTKGHPIIHSRGQSMPLATGGIRFALAAEIIGPFKVTNQTFSQEGMSRHYTHHFIVTAEQVDFLFVIARRIDGCIFHHRRFWRSCLRNVCIYLPVIAMTWICKYKHKTCIWKQLVQILNLAAEFISRKYFYHDHIRKYDVNFNLSV